MSFTVVIPARYGSSRFPGKPLAEIAGKPMVQWVYEQAKKSRANRVLVATDDQRIADRCAAFGAEVCMTSSKHPSGTDRLQEVAEALGLSEDAIIVNVQGDEPLIPPRLINQVAENMAEYSDAGIATLAEPIACKADLLNPNVVKVITDHRDMAIYFSRAPIAYPRDAMSAGLPDVLPEIFPWRRHIGMYAYRVGFLNRYVSWPPAQVELVESLEQLRALWHGVPIHVAEALEAPPAGVDTPDDLERVRALIEAGL